MKTSLADRISLALAGPPKVTQRELAQACGIHPVSVNGWVKGRTQTIEASHLLAAAAFLKVRPRWLAEGLGPMRAEKTDDASDGWARPRRATVAHTTQESAGVYARQPAAAAPTPDLVVEAFIRLLVEADDIARQQSLPLIEALVRQPERSAEFARRLSATLTSGSAPPERKKTR
jgi:transcriptional regulator with XRE-family HTH domain